MEPDCALEGVFEKQSHAQKLKYVPLTHACVIGDQHRKWHIILISFDHDKLCLIKSKYHLPKGIELNSKKHNLWQSTSNT